MGKYVGVDWAKKGWFAVALKDGKDYEVDLFPSILNLWGRHSDAERVLIDIPIGLNTEGKRRCDVEAKNLLKPLRSNSVFHIPVRKAVYSKTLKEAKEINEEYGYSITNQAWAICPSIRELDQFLGSFPNAIGVIKESHPEVCFSALNSGNPMGNKKKSEEGVEERKQTLFTKDNSLKSIYKDAVKTFIEQPQYARRISKNDKDDILDALALAKTATKKHNQLNKLPSKNKEIDNSKEKSLPIEIVY